MHVFICRVAVTLAGDVYWCGCAVRSEIWPDQEKSIQSNAFIFFAIRFGVIFLSTWCVPMNRWMRWKPSNGRPIHGVVSQAVHTKGPMLTTTAVFCREDSRTATTMFNSVCCCVTMLLRGDGHVHQGLLLCNTVTEG